MLAATPSPKAPPTNRAPIDFECEIASLPLQGTLPPGLTGTLVRNGPNPWVPDPRAHWFSGDGMLHAFRIEPGRVSYRNRWVRTGQLALEQRTGRNSAAVPLPPAGDSADDGAANTHVVRHAGRVLALEEAHRPIEVVLDTLATVGPTDFDGGLPCQAFTAHPHADPATGELLFFGYGTPERLSSGMAFGVLSPAGRVTRFETFEAPYASMVHDFAITARHVVFPIMPLAASRARAETGRPAYAWEPALGTRVGVMPRDGSVRDLVWWQGPPCYAFHVMNAWDEGDSVCLDVMQFERPPLFPLPDGQPAAGPREPARLTRWRLDRSDPAHRFVPQVLSELSGEFPRIDERRTGQPYRHGWYVGNLPGDERELRMACALVHVDHGQPGAPRTALYALPSGDRSSEAVFVPRSADAPEGEGWLLAVIYRGAMKTSELAVFDAQRLAAGPVCLATLPHRVPDGFHGNWFADDGVVS
ncbi:MAG: carotenoid oxygenase family protein [Proteobacteria bacterium]|nr:carotenoid oxygenase family protein [Pseudomonadota bacterium]